MLSTMEMAVQETTTVRLFSPGYAQTYTSFLGMGSHPSVIELPGSAFQARTDYSSVIFVLNIQTDTVHQKNHIWSHLDNVMRTILLGIFNDESEDSRYFFVIEGKYCLRDYSSLIFVFRSTSRQQDLHSEH